MHLCLHVCVCCTLRRTKDGITIWCWHQRNIVSVRVTPELTQVQLECYLTSVQPIRLSKKFDIRNWIWQVKKYFLSWRSHHSWHLHHQWAILKSWWFYAKCNFIMRLAEVLILDPLYKLVFTHYTGMLTWCNKGMVLSTHVYDMTNVIVGLHNEGLK